MNQLPPPPTSDEIRRIATILRKKGSLWADILENEGETIELSSDDIDSITDQLFEEFHDQLDSNQEPNRYGVEIDDLIGALQRMRPNFYNT